MIEIYLQKSDFKSVEVEVLLMSEKTKAASRDSVSAAARFVASRLEQYTPIGETGNLHDAIFYDKVVVPPRESSGRFRSYKEGDTYAARAGFKRSHRITLRPHIEDGAVVTNGTMRYPTIEKYLGTVEKGRGVTIPVRKEILAWYDSSKPTVTKKGKPLKGPANVFRVAVGEREGVHMLARTEEETIAWVRENLENFA